MPNSRRYVAPSRAKHIRKIAEDILVSTGHVVAPIPIDRVAQAKGIQVLYAPYDGNDLAGMLIRQDGKAIIAVNSAHPKNRQRFTIAHECGHYFLDHMKESHVDSGFAQVWNRDSVSATATDMHEVEANFLAAELLMPRFLLEADLADQQIDYEDGEVVAALAKKYAVSTQAMTYRIANLLFSPS